MSATTYKDQFVTQQIYVFGELTTLTRHLMEIHWDGFSWNWTDQGRPPGSIMVSMTQAITYKDANGYQEIYAFVRNESNHHLAVNRWDGHSWQWADLGIPSGVFDLYSLSAITYFDGIQRIYVFAAADTGHLLAASWSGLFWNWTDHGQQSPGQPVGEVSATTVLDKAGKQEIFVFVSTSLSANGFVYVFNGSGWWWQYIGTIPKHSWTAPAAVSYLDQASTTRVYAFPQVSSNTLSEKYLDSAGWHTASLFSPMYTASDPSAVTFKEVQSAIPFIYVFYLGHDGPGDGHLYMLSSSPFGWQWSDQGTM